MNPVPQDDQELETATTAEATDDNTETAEDANKEDIYIEWAGFI